MAIANQYNVITRCISTGTSSRRKQASSSFPIALTPTPSLINTEISIRFIPGSLNIDLGKPFGGSGKTRITELPLHRVPCMEEPLSWKPNYEDVPSADKTFELPTTGITQEKQAKEILRIRKRKMKKHKLKKLRNKMKFVWERIRVNRNIKKEKAFQLELQKKIETVMQFDAKAYVDSRLTLLNKKRFPYTWRGEILPQAQIIEFMEEKRRKKEAKRNRPRLTL